MVTQSLLYIEKSKATLYSPDKQDKLVLEFPKDIINHMEIVDKEKFHALIADFIETNEIKPSNLLILLDQEITFEKSFDNTPLSLQTSEIEEFLEIVPFHSIISKTYRLNKKVKVIAANKEFCEELVKIFEEKSFAVIGIVPFAITQELLPKMKDAIDVKLIFKRIDFLKQYSMLDISKSPEKLITYEKPQWKSPQFVVLISILGILLLIFLVLLFTRLLH